MQVLGLFNSCPMRLLGLILEKADLKRLMCARYTAIKDLSAVIEAVQCVNRVGEWQPRYNIAPGQQAPAVAMEDSRAELRLMRWGLIPSWAKPGSTFKPLVNVRAESLEQKPAFRRAFQQRRCLIPADGFYEWEDTSEGKTPHLFKMADGSMFCFAGLWESREIPDDSRLELDLPGLPERDSRLETYAIITTAPNEIVGRYHGRMPVILPLEACASWLDVETPLPELRRWLRPFPAEKLTERRVSRWVNNSSHEGPECIREV